MKKVYKILFLLLFLTTIVFLYETKAFAAEFASAKEVANWYDNYDADAIPEGEVIVLIELKKGSTIILGEFRKNISVSSTDGKTRVVDMDIAAMAEEQKYKAIYNNNFEPLRALAYKDRFSTMNLEEFDTMEIYVYIEQGYLYDNKSDDIGIIYNGNLISSSMSGHYFSNDGTDAFAMHIGPRFTEDVKGGYDTAYWVTINNFPGIDEDKLELRIKLDIKNPILERKKEAEEEVAELEEEIAKLEAEKEEVYELYVTELFKVTETDDYIKLLEESMTYFSQELSFIEEWRSNKTAGYMTFEILQFDNPYRSVEKKLMTLNALLSSLYGYNEIWNLSSSEMEELWREIVTYPETEAVVFPNAVGAETGLECLEYIIPLKKQVEYLESKESNSTAELMTIDENTQKAKNYIGSLKPIMDELINDFNERIEKAKQDCELYSKNAVDYAAQIEILSDKIKEMQEKISSVWKDLETFKAQVLGGDNRIWGVFEDVFDSISYYVPEDSTEGADKLTSKVSVILTVITNIGMIVAILMLAIIGVKYMLGSVEEKAEYKKDMIPYLVGACLLFGICTIVGVLQSIGNNINNV